MRITGHIFGVRLLAGSLECLPGNVGGDGSGVRVQHFLNGVVPLATMAVDAVFLVGQDVLLVLHKEVRHLLAGGHDHRAGRVVTIILDHAAVTGGIGDVKVVVAAAGGKHIVLLQQLHGLGGCGGAVQHQADGHSGSQHRLAGILFGWFAVQRQHSNRNALLVDAVQAGKGCQQAGNFGLGAGIGLVGTQVKLLTEYADEVVLSYDSDEAGQKATARSLAMFTDADIKVRVLSYQGAKDPDEFIKKYGKERFAMLLDGSADPTEFQLKKAAANYDLRDSAGRLNYLKDAIDILARKGVTPTARDVYAGRLVEETGVGKKAILEQMNDVLRSTQRRDRRKEQRDLAGQGNAADIRVPYSAGGDAALGAASAGRQLIAALLQSPEKIPYVRQRLNMDAVVLPEMQEALRAIFRCADEQLPVNITSLQQMLDDKPMAEVNRAQAVNAGHPLQQEDIDMYLERLDNAKPISQTVKGTTDDQFLSAFSKLRKEKGAADPPQSD